MTTSMTTTSVTARCTTPGCGHGPDDHQALSPQCSAARCACLKYRPPALVAAPVHVPVVKAPPAASPPAPAAPAASPPAPAAPAASPTAPTPDDLIRACARSESKRTRARGVKLAALVDEIRTALRAERETAEAKAERAKERASALAEVKRLEKALAEARAKAVAAGAPGGVRGGPRPCPECGDQLASPQALGAHRRHKHDVQGGHQ